MGTDVKQNCGQSNRDLKDKQDQKNTEQDGYVDASDLDSGVVKRHPNLVAIDLDDNSDHVFEDDLDDDENNE